MYNPGPDSTTAYFPEVKTIQRSAGRFWAYLAEFNCIAFSGVLLSPARLLAGSQARNWRSLTVEETLSSTGEYLTIFRHQSRSDEFLIVPDAFALQQLFYFSPSDKRGLGLSTSARLLGGIRNRIGGRPTVNWSALALLTGTTDSWASTANTDEALLEDHFLLRPFEAIHIDGGEATIVSLRDDPKLQGLDYESLLQQGIERAGQQLARLAADSRYTALRLNLSGGRDSRLVLALAANAGVERAFRVRSVNPKTWGVRAAVPGLERDLIVADALRRHFGLEWDRKPSSTSTELPPYENLADWQRYRSGLDFRLPARRSLTVLNEPIAELRGAGGETFRAFWSQYLAKTPAWNSVKNESATFEWDAQTMFNYHYRTTLLPREWRDKAFSSYIAILRATGKPTFAEAADTHFTWFRNHSHFGTTMDFARTGATPFFPLHQLEFVLAGELAEVELRRKGAVFFDLFEHACPTLNDLEFDDGPWCAEMQMRKQAGRVVFDSLPNNVDQLTDYFDNERSGTPPRVRPGQQVFSEKCFIASEMREVIQELKELDGGPDFFDTPVTSALVNLCETNLGYASHALSKLHSLRDLLIGSRIDDLMVLGGEDTQRSLLVPARFPEWSDTFRTTLSTVMFRVDVKRTADNRLTAEILLDSADSAQLSFAFYLKRSGEVVARTDYTDSHVTSFEAPRVQADYQVQAFVRRTGTRPMTFSLYSRPVP